MHRYPLLLQLHQDAGSARSAQEPPRKEAGAKEGLGSISRHSLYSHCHIPEHALIKMERTHGGGDEMTRRERGKQGNLARAMPALQPVALFFGLLLLLSLVGRNMSSRLFEEVALSFILMAVAADAGFLYSKQSTLKAWIAAGIVAGIFLGILCLGALFLYSQTPELEDLLLTGARILAGSLIGAVVGEKRRPRRKK